MIKQMWDMISIAFDEVDAPNRIIVSVPELRSKMWKIFHINKIEFGRILNILTSYESPYRNKILYSGAPSGAYTKSNFVELHGRHYLYIEVKTSKHEEYMEGHRS